MQLGSCNPGNRLVRGLTWARVTHNTGMRLSSATLSVAESIILADLGLNSRPKSKLNLGPRL